MSKQEEIDIGFRILLGALFNEDDDQYLCETSGQLLDFLRSRGVVIKVKCPHCIWSQFKDEAVGMTPCNSCNSTGYIYEPLMKE